MVQIGELVGDAPEPAEDRLVGRSGQHAVDHQHQLARPGEGRAEVLLLRAGLEVLLDRSVRQPRESARDTQLDVIVGQQLEEPDAVELHQELDALGFRQRVRLADLFEAEVIERAQGDQQQPAVGHDAALLLQGELLDVVLAAFQLARQLGDAGARQVAHLFEAIQREVAGGEQPLHAGLAQAERACHLCVRHAARFEGALERLDHRFHLLHRCLPLAGRQADAQATMRAPPHFLDPRTFSRVVCR